MEGNLQINYCIHLSHCVLVVYLSQWLNFAGVEKTWSPIVLFGCVCIRNVIKPHICDVCVCKCVCVIVSYFEPEIRMYIKYYDDIGDESSLDSLNLTAEVTSTVIIASDPTILLS